MDKTTLLEKIKNKNFSQEQLIGWVTALPGSNKTRKPSKDKRGDVYMHPIFLHPYVLLEKKNDFWICCLITSESTCSEILMPCKSRFFTDNYFTRTIFTVTEPTGSFVNPYENTRHLNILSKELKQIFI
jgi:hypothetical protein